MTKQVSETLLQNQDKCAKLPVANMSLQFTEADLEAIREIKRLVIPFLNRLQEIEGKPPVIVPGGKRKT